MASAQHTAAKQPSERHKRERDGQNGPSHIVQRRACIKRSIRGEVLRVSIFSLRPPTGRKIHQPGLRNEKERREKKPQKRVQPDQRDVECAKGYTNPQNAKRTIRVHEKLPLRRCGEDRRATSDGKVVSL